MYANCALGSELARMSACRAQEMVNCNDVMNYYRIAPIKSLNPFIRNYAYVNGDGVADYQQRVLPSGCLGLLFFRRSPLIYVDDNGVTYRNHAVIHGVYNKYMDVCPYNVEMIGVYFQPFGARLFFDFPITELKGIGATPTDLGDKELMQLEEEIMTAPDIFKCVNLLDEFFMKRIARNYYSEYGLKRVRHVLTQCLAPDKVMTVQEMADAACLSSRQLSRVFGDFTGFSPKSFMRIFRFQRALSALHDKNSMLGNKKDDETKLIDVAWENGYYDLSHMNADFMQLSGSSPKNILERMTMLRDLSDTLL